MLIYFKSYIIWVFDKEKKKKGKRNGEYFEPTLKILEHGKT